MPAPEPNSDNPSVEPYEPWVYEILSHLAYDGRALGPDDADNPYPGEKDWGIVDDLIDAATRAAVPLFEPWFVYPFRNKGRRAAVRYSHGDGTESLWTSEDIADHWPSSEMPTWADVVSHTLTSLTSLHREDLSRATVRRMGSGAEGGRDRFERSSSTMPVDDHEDEPMGENVSPYSQWVFRVLDRIIRNGRALGREVADEPYSRPPNWGIVEVIFETATDIMDSTAPWIVTPTGTETATLRYLNDDESESVWTAVDIVDHWPSSEAPTWGEIITHTVSSVVSIKQSTADHRVPPPAQQAREEHIEQMQNKRREAAHLHNRIRLVRTARGLVVGPVIAGCVTFVTAVGFTVFTAKRFDMTPYNIAALLLLLLLLILFIVGRRMDTGMKEGEEYQSVAELRLELDLLEERRILEAAHSARSSYERQYSYRETIPHEIDRLRRETRRYRRVHNFFQWSLFFASVTMSVTAAVYDPPQPGKGILIGLGAFISFTTAVTGYFKFRERAFNLQQTADSIEQHAIAFDLAISPYNHSEARTNLERLAETVELLRVEQRKREQQLEQPHQGQSDVI
ncbi:DUF4231 domain-containing protein [Streptomyces microflavus]|uniref:DUF4231 domain-containing protein n=1 Tax=Streptomyces microflavus TaxID=1919 RepID=UPI0029AD8D7C|nr:DUF4231 domain-containing protein [Streptomyces microflavus]MDX2407624.1 DUF4231 domain-containing protein [Streptomyces microflavus]